MAPPEEAHWACIEGGRFVLPVLGRKKKATIEMKEDLSRPEDDLDGLYWSFLSFLAMAIFCVGNLNRKTYHVLASEALNQLHA